MTDNVVLREQVAQVALKQMFRPDGRFYINDLDSIALCLGRIFPGPVREILHPLHCVSWADMPPDLRACVVSLVVEGLGMTLKEVAPEPPQEKHRTGFLRLFSGGL